MSRKRLLSPVPDETSKLLDTDISDEHLERLESISKEVARVDLINGTHLFCTMTFPSQRPSLIVAFLRVVSLFSFTDFCEFREIFLRDGLLRRIRVD